MKWEINNPKTVVEIDEGKKFEVMFPEAVYSKMMAYIDAVDGEISGMGEVAVVDGVYIVRDIWLLKQECTGASTSIDAVSLADLRAEVFAQGKAKDGFQLWWHSHANMDTFWSGTDKATMQMFMQDIDWMLFVVANKKRSVRARLEFKTPLIKFAYEDLPVSVVSAETVDKASVDEEVKRKVKDKSYGWQDHGYGRRTYSPTPMRTDWVDTDDPSLIGSPADRGEKYWSSLTRAEKRMTRRYTGEESPMCLIMPCQVCQVKKFSFYSQKRKQSICLGCIETWVASMQAGAQIDYHTKPMEKPKIDEDPTLPGINTQEGA